MTIFENLRGGMVTLGTDSYIKHAETRKTPVSVYSYTRVILSMCFKVWISFVQFGTESLCRFAYLIRYSARITFTVANVSVNSKRYHHRAFAKGVFDWDHFCFW